MNNSENDDERDETIDDDPRAAAQDSVQCPACFRRMRRAVFANHPNVCRENPTKKRHVSVFDMTRYRSIRSGDKVLPVRKISPIATNPSHSHSLRPSQTRSAKRDRRSDTVVPPIISSFCTFLPSERSTRLDLDRAVTGYSGDTPLDEFFFHCRLSYVQADVLRESLRSSRRVLHE